MKNPIVNNFLTFDIEEWYHANYSDVKISSQQQQAPTNLNELVAILLEMCARHEVKATFFIVGEVAAAKPHIVKQIQAAGHEIASHSHRHQLTYQLGPKKFKEDLQRSVEVLEHITGEKIVGYRSPSWSVDTQSLPWYYETLLEEGLRYSSSVFPVKTFLYGIPDAPRYPHKVVVGKQSLTEIPCSTIHIAGRNTGFSGGFYLRTLPYSVIDLCTWQLNKQAQPVIFYLHPREIDPHQPQLKLPFMENFIHYHGVAGCQSKFERLIAKHRSTFQHTLREINVR